MQICELPFLLPTSSDIHPDFRAQRSGDGGGLETSIRIIRIVQNILTMQRL